MGVNSGLKDKKSSAPFEARRGIESKTSNKCKSDIKSEVDFSPVRPKSSPNSQFKSLGKIPRLRPRTAIPRATTNNSGLKVDEAKTKIKPADKNLTNKTNLSPPPKKNEVNNECDITETLTIKSEGGKADENNTEPKNFNGLQEENQNACDSTKESSNIEADSSLKEFSLNAANISSKLKDPSNRKNETPKISSVASPSGNSSKGSQDSQKTNQGIKMKFNDGEPIKKKFISEKIKEALKEDFSALLPLYQTEMKKITDVWVTTIYISLTMRSHLVKLLVDAFPNINIDQFQTEDDRLLKCVGQAKAYTEAETENLIQFIKSLLKSRNSAKQENEIIMEEKEIANMYSNNWSLMMKKLAELADETRKLQIAIPEEEKKKGIYEKKMKEKIRDTEEALVKKQKEINKLINQLTILKQKELNFQDSVVTKLEDFNEIKANIESLKTIEQEYQNLKNTYLEQSEIYKEKIDTLESLLEEKKKTLEKQRQMKNQMQTILELLQAQQQRLRKSNGSDPVDYILRQTRSSKEKAREQLLIAAVKLVLRGMFTN